MLESPLGHDQSQRSTADAPSWRWVTGIGLAVAVGSAYFLAAQLSLGLLIKPDGVAVFWPAAGISSGVLIALGPHARWPVAAGAMAATVAANLMGDRDIWAAAAFAVCNAAEALITAGLIQHYFGTVFSLDRLRQVLGLLAAAVTLTVISGIGERSRTSCSTAQLHRCSPPGGTGSHPTPSASSLWRRS
jgi:integral membrane sensor domain MASE1